MTAESRDVPEGREGRAGGIEALVAITTCGSRADAEALARGLVDSGHAACVQLLDIQSVYRWRGGVQQEPEVALLIKTTRDQYPSLARYVDEHHPYELPELIALPVVAGSPAYLSWLATPDA